MHIVKSSARLEVVPHNFDILVGRCNYYDINLILSYYVVIFKELFFFHHSEGFNDIVLPFPLKLSVTEDGLAAETDLTRKPFTRDWLLI